MRMMIPKNRESSGMSCGVYRGSCYASSITTFTIHRPRSVRWLQCIGRAGSHELQSTRVVTTLQLFHPLGVGPLPVFLVIVTLLLILPPRARAPPSCSRRGVSTRRLSAENAAGWIVHLAELLPGISGAANYSGVCSGF